MVSNIWFADTLTKKALCCLLTVSFTQTHWSFDHFVLIYVWWDSNITQPWMTLKNSFWEEKGNNLIATSEKYGEIDAHLRYIHANC